MYIVRYEYTHTHTHIHTHVYMYNVLNMIYYVYCSARLK